MVDLSSKVGGGGVGEAVSGKMRMYGWLSVGANVGTTSW